MSKLRIGTAGYSYNDWRGKFYPSHLASRDFLSHYANFFNCVEINATYYKIPSPKVFSSISLKVPNSFKFTVKVPNTFTHYRDKFAQTLEQFRMATSPLVKKGMLACYLAQFPFSFKNTEENIEYVSTMANNLDRPVAVEFRRRDWHTEDVYTFLRAQGICYVNVDAPKIRGLPIPSTIATSSIGYCRFHGRNAAKWWNHIEAYERYDYSYTPEELQEWAPRIEKISGMTESTYVMFNNHYQGQAIDGAEEMKRLMNLAIGQSTL